VTTAYATHIDASLTQQQQQQQKQIMLEPLLHQLADFIVALACSMRWANVNVDDDRLQSEVRASSSNGSCCEQAGIISGGAAPGGGAGPWWWALPLVVGTAQTF
jgi:hypothetical protein